MLGGEVYRLPEQTDKELAEEARLRRLPWTTGDYERLRRSVLALIRTHVSWDRPGGDTRPSFDGAAYWNLLGALDRANERTTIGEEV